MEEDEYEEDFEGGPDVNQYCDRDTEEQAEVLDSAPSPPIGHRSGKSRDAIVEILGEEQDEELERIDSYLETKTHESTANPQQTLKQVQKENNALMSELKQMSDQLDMLLDRKAAKATKPPRAAQSAPGQGSDQQLRTALKKLQTIKKERNKLYEKLKRLVDPTYAADLAQEVEKLSKQLDQLQRQNRSKSQGQRGREKSLERLAREDEVSTAMKAIIEEKGTIKILKEKLATADEEIERIASTLVSLEEREEDLIAKHSALQIEAEELGISVAAEGKRKKQTEELVAAREACKREMGAAVLSSDTQVKKLKRREAELMLELQGHQDESKRLSRDLLEKQQVLEETKRHLVDLNEMSAGTDVELLAKRVLRRVRTKSRDISVPLALEENVPRSTKSSEPGTREVKADFRIRSRPVQSQSSKSLINQAAPKPPLKPKGLPRPSPRPVEDPETRPSPGVIEQHTDIDSPPVLPVVSSMPESLPALEEPRMSSETTDKDKANYESPTEEEQPMQLSNPYEKAADTLLSHPVVESPPQALFLPATQPPLSNYSDDSPPVHELPSLKPIVPRDRSHLFTQEEAPSQPPKGLMERKVLKQRSIHDSRTDELAKKAEEKHGFFDPEDSDQFADVQKQLVAVRSEKRETSTQQVVVQYRLHPHELEEQDLT